MCPDSGLYEVTHWHYDQVSYWTRKWKTVGYPVVRHGQSIDYVLQNKDLPGEEPTVVMFHGVMVTQDISNLRLSMAQTNFQKL